MQDMHIDQGDTVLAADGTDLGKVRRVVIDPASRSLTHLVVGGGFLTADRVVPVELVEGEEDERTIRLGSTVHVEDLPMFEEQYTVPVAGERQGDPRPLAWYHPYGVSGAYPAFLDFGPAPVGQVTRNVPEGTTALEIGAGVRASDDARVGEVDEVITNPDTDAVESFVVSSGFLFTERTMIPVGWVERWEEEEIRLSVESRVLEELPPYDG